MLPLLLYPSFLGSLSRDHHYCEYLPDLFYTNHGYASINGCVCVCAHVFDISIQSGLLMRMEVYFPFFHLNIFISIYLSFLPFCHTWQQVVHSAFFTYCIFATVSCQYIQELPYSFLWLHHNLLNSPSHFGCFQYPVITVSLNIRDCIHVPLYLQDKVLKVQFQVKVYHG